MTYDNLRHIADSYGLILLGIVFVTMIGWTFRPGSRSDYRRASRMIFDEERDDG